MTRFPQPALPPARLGWADLIVFGLFAAALAGILDLANNFSGTFAASTPIDLSLWAIPKYTFFTFARGMLALALSLVFAIGYAVWAYRDPAARRFLLPCLDILQSIPVLGFLPGLVLALVALFPHSMIGLELACILMIFTAQAWNLAFSFYDSLRAVPEDLRTLSRFYQYTPWQTFVRLELPCGIRGLTFNIIISLAAGWFLITVEEAFTLGNKDFRLQGLGAYISVAMEHGNITAQIAGIAAMAGMIVAIDVLMLRPLIVWSRRFKIEDTQVAEPEDSFVLRWMQRSQVMHRLGEIIRRGLDDASKPRAADPSTRHDRGKLEKWGYGLLIAAVIGVMTYGFWNLGLMLVKVSLHEWLRLLGDFALTLLRVIAALALSAAWTIPVGVWIGLHPVWSQRLQPVIQIFASFPAPIIYPLIIGAYLTLGGTLQTGAVVLMMLGTQWYILFNVISAAGSIPQDLLSCADSLRLQGWKRWQLLYFPAIFPALVTGMITAAGGAWNTSIVAEFVQYRGRDLEATGLGALITQATNDGNFPLLAAAITLMAVAVVTINRTIWRPLQTYAADRFALNL
jgi:NitT/TauT family transport system permease protein